MYVPVVQCSEPLDLDAEVKISLAGRLKEWTFLRADAVFIKLTADKENNHNVLLVVVKVKLTHWYDKN